MLMDHGGGAQERAMGHSPAELAARVGSQRIGSWDQIQTQMFTPSFTT